MMTLLGLFAGYFALSLPAASAELPLAVGRATTRVKVLESNNVNLRPGSVYDIVTYFESLPALPRPKYRFEFVDLGLGSVEPLFPIYLQGAQGSWAQVLAGLVSANNRHLDQFSKVKVMEGCVMYGLNAVRPMTEFPSSSFTEERAQGYELVAIRVEYYERIKPDAECGKHRSFVKASSFDPEKVLKQFTHAKSWEDFPARYLDKVEANLAVVKTLSQVLDRDRWPRLDTGKFKENSLWYYPKGTSPDHGVSTPRLKPGLRFLSKAADLLIVPSQGVRAALKLERFLSAGEFSSLMEFLSGNPVPNYDPKLEPGYDVLRLADVTNRNIYTSGLHLERIQDVRSDVGNPRNFSLVGVTLKPSEDQIDVHQSGEIRVPQVHLVYQMMDPRSPKRPFEQLFLHLKVDVADRDADLGTRRAQTAYFMARIDQITEARTKGGAEYDALLIHFFKEFASRPVESLAFSSSLTGVWVFGSLSRAYNAARELLPVRIIRQGVDVGYYSSVFDQDVFERSSELPQVRSLLNSLSVDSFRDPRRADARRFRFNQITCAQCHHLAGRDAIHLGFNDGTDRRYTYPVRASEFLMHELDRQLEQSE